MKKRFFIILTVICCSSINAQKSDTYEIEKLSSSDYPDQLYQKIEQNLVQISVTDDLVLNDAHPVLDAFHRK